MKVKILKIARFTTKKDGTPLTGKYGPYTALRINTDIHQENTLSGFENPVSKLWREGDEVEITVTESVTDGKTYLNFTTPKPIEAANEKSELILNKMVGLQMQLHSIEAKLDRLLIGNGPKDTRDPGYPTQSNETAFDEYDI